MIVKCSGLYLRLCEFGQCKSACPIPVNKSGLVSEPAGQNSPWVGGRVHCDEAFSAHHQPLSQETPGTSNTFPGTLLSVLP